MKNYYKYILESNIEYFKITDIDWLLYLVERFYTILKIHEEKMYGEVKIATDPEFKKEIDKCIGNFQNGFNYFSLVEIGRKKLKALSGKDREKFVGADKPYNLVREYEKKLHKDEKITTKDLDTSLYGVCTSLFEEQEEGEGNQWIDKFSSKDVFVEEFYEMSDEEREGLGLNSKDYGLDGNEELEMIVKIREKCKEIIRDDNLKRSISNLEKVKKEKEFQHEYYQDWIDEKISDAKEDLEAEIAQKPLRDEAEKKMKKIFNQYENIYKNNELRLLMALIPRIEDELDANEHDDIYYDILVDALEILEKKLRDKGIK